MKHNGLEISYFKVISQVIKFNGIFLWYSTKPNFKENVQYSHLGENGPPFEKSIFWGIYNVLTWMGPETKLKFGVLRSFWCVYRKNPSTPSRDIKFWKYPPLKTALLKTGKRPSFFKIKKNGFLVVRITISDHHINSTIVFFILCAKYLKKTASDYKI